MMTGAGLRAETEATLLLCGSIGTARREEVAEPLNVREFNEVLDVLARLSIDLSELLQPGTLDRVRESPEGKATLTERVEALLQRGTALAMAVERWTSQGFWVLDRTAPAYPERFHRHLGKSAPPLLYGAGDHHLLNRDQARIAVVGSRDIDDEGEAFARSVGAGAAEIDVMTVSGGARGADRTAINGALDNGGTGVAILPGALEQVATSRAYRQSIVDGQFVVISPYHPRAKFTAGNAMGRNRLIYCLSDVGIVVESAMGSGGTWSGAMETLKHRWVPVAVRQTAHPSEGNAALLNAGAQPLTPATLADPGQFSQWLQETVEQHHTARRVPRHGQLDLFGDG